MHLTSEEERYCSGEMGETLAKAMEILVALGDIYNAERLVPVRSVQIAGVSFKNIGDAGLEWISDLHGQVAVPSILNPSGMDHSRWPEMGIDEDFAEKQKATIDAYRRLGIADDCTCVPYRIYPYAVRKGDHLAWSESSAISYANSVIGARTNREGGPSALAAALVGKTPLYGYHLDENRVPTLSVAVDADLKGSDYGALGFLVGRIVSDGVPIFRLKNRPSTDELKSLGAAMAASGSVALYYVEDITPPPPMREKSIEEMAVEPKDIREVYEKYSPDDVEIIALGCPHCSAAELSRIADMLDGKKAVKELWICTARKIAEACPDIVSKIERSGAKVICDTCMVVSPASERYNKMMTDSGKALAYIPGLCGIKACFGSTSDCIREATGGR